MGKLWPWIAVVCLCGCSSISFSDHGRRADAPFFFMRDEHPSADTNDLAYENDFYRPMQDTSPALTGPDGGQSAGNASLTEPAVPGGCRLQDRFDSDALVAYNFDDDQARIALHMNMGSVGFDGAQVDKVEIKFHYRLQPIKTPQERCRYKSNWQGLVGTGYHEFAERQHNTVMDNIRDQFGQ